ncbi:MAG: hypothetical protein WCF78_04595, partial [archaeon]
MQIKRLNNDEIISFVSEFASGLTPSNLAKKLNLKPQTAKSILYRLSTEGKLKRDYLGNRGFYGISVGFQNTGDGIVWRTEPKVQNFELIYENCGIGEEFYQQRHYPSDENPIWNILVRSSKTGNLTVLFSGEFGYDFSSVAVLSRNCIDEINTKYGCTIDINKLQITRIETFNDFYKLGLSKNSMFFTDFEGTMLKIYDKGDRLRVEKRLTKRMPLDAIFQNLANPDILKYSSQVTDLSLKFDEMSKQVNRCMKSMK